MKREILMSILGVVLFSGQQALAAKIKFKGDSKGTVVAGSYEKKPGDTRTSTPDQVKDQAIYAKRYDGEVNVEADYTIVFKADKTLDTTKSSVKLDTLSFALFGKQSKFPFTTPAIKIIEVTLTNKDPKMIESFKFKSDDWYDPKASGFNAIIDKGISGFVDLKNGKTFQEASYIYKPNATLNTFKVTGVIVKPGPAPGPGPDPDDLPLALQNIYSPAAVPEPATWLVLAAGLAGIAGLRLGKKQQLRSVGS